MSRVTEGWNGKIDEFEKINQGLHDSLSKLRDENELLRLKVCIVEPALASVFYLRYTFFNTGGAKVNRTRGYQS